MSLIRNIRPAPPTIALLVYIGFIQIVEFVYFGYELNIPPLFEYLHPIAYLGLISWWLQIDSRKTNVRWPLDLGMFLYSGWVFIVPYHLIKTRGAKGVADILMFVAAVVVVWVLTAIAVGFVLV